MAEASAIEVSTSPESVELLHRIQDLVIADQPEREQGLCLAAEFLVWALLTVSESPEEAVELFDGMIEGIIQNIRDNGPAMVARKKLLRELAAPVSPKWVN